MRAETSLAQGIAIYLNRCCRPENDTMLATAVTKLETTLVSGICSRMGRRIYSTELEIVLIQMIRAQVETGGITRSLAPLMRLAIKTCPYSANAETLIVDHGRVMRIWGQQAMPELMATIDACNRLQLPVPLVVSCKKYLPRALLAQASFQTRYFGIGPIILRGDREASEETFDGRVLCLPVDDSYEGLPIKMFESFVLFSALGAHHGIVKLDDDLQFLPSSGAFDLASIRTELASAHYMGLALSSLHHDRVWHLGKCESAVPTAYGKPFRAPWARGALYALSGHAVTMLAHHYLRFPGCLAGELYEDKAVGDVLHEAGVPLRDRPLEQLFGVSTEAPDRLVAAE